MLSSNVIREQMRLHRIRTVQADMKNRLMEIKEKVLHLCLYNRQLHVTDYSLWYCRSPDDIKQFFKDRPIPGYNFRAICKLIDWTFEIPYDSKTHIRRYYDEVTCVLDSIDVPAHDGIRLHLDASFDEENRIYADVQRKMHDPSYVIPMEYKLTGLQCSFITIEDIFDLNLPPNVTLEEIRYAQLKTEAIPIYGMMNDLIGLLDMHDLYVHEWLGF